MENKTKSLFERSEHSFQQKIHDIVNNFSQKENKINKPAKLIGNSVESYMYSEYAVY